MKTKLLLILLFISSYAFTQTPSDFTKSYSFTGGLLEGLVLTNGAYNPSSDRIGVPSNAVDINTATFNMGTVSTHITDMSLSFWIKTSNTSNTTLTIFNHGYASQTNYGFECILWGGNKIGLQGKMAVINSSTGATSTHNGGIISSPDITDGQWHHVVLTTQKITSGNNEYIRYSIYINGTLDGSSNGSSAYTTNNVLRFLSPSAQTYIGQNSPVKYSDELDDIRFYERTINSSEVLSLYNETVISHPGLPKVYVDEDATGNNSGDSWLNAIPNLNTALAEVGSITEEVWIAAGTYTPHISDENESFKFLYNDLEVYGGFDGTEITLLDRDMSLLHTTNATILSGDLLNNDDVNVTYNNATRSDNSLRVVQINGNNIVIDGVTIANGYADASSGEGRFGAGLDTDDAVTNFTIKNAIIKNNVAWWSAGLALASNMSPSTMTIDACVFENNLSSGSTAFYALPRANKTMNFNLTNSLFKNNRTEDNTTSRKGYGTSAGFIRAYYPGSTINAKVANNTFVNNSSSGTDSTSDFPVLGVSQVGGTLSLTPANNIFWGNTNNVGTTAIAIGIVNDNLPNNLAIYNSIDEDNFSNHTYLSNTSNTNPLFTDAANDDFTLQATSPAVDTGDNTKIPSGVVGDLLNNLRIFNTTVDMGCYEFGATSLGVNTFAIKNDFTIYPNPTSKSLNIKTNNPFEQVEIYTLQGQKVLETNQESIDVSSLSNGMYLIQVQTETGAVLTKQFIKR